MNMLETMEKLLTPSDKRLLSEIFAPQVVGIPPEDARRCITVMPDGELRCYGIVKHGSVFDNTGDPIYLFSRDCGLSWKRCYAEPGVLGACVQVPGKQRFITIKGDRNPEHSGTFGYVSAIGPDDTAPTEFKITDTYCYDMFQPVQLSDGRWLCSMQRTEPVMIDGKELLNYHPVVMRSDDDGESWQLTQLSSAPRFEVVWPHKGLRWENNGSECTLTELPDGRILLIARTAQDYFYAYYSSDRGESWTDGVPSPFHGTLTTPFLLKLSDGRILHFWNNTQPLPEYDHARQWPPLAHWELDGLGEDAFTNRDANHVAITEDGGKSWLGFRELALNEIRNAADFRSAGGMLSSGDKSVHQFQAIELPYGKVLVAYGQHEISRRLAIFDVRWLYETARTELFHEGLKNLTTHVFVKGVCGSHLGEGIPGHCAWNRTNGALLVPDPDATYGEALQINRIHDPRLLSELQGAVWNFPAMKQGVVSMSLRVEGAGLRVSLTDRWMNAADEFVAYYAQLSVKADSLCVETGKWVTLAVSFDTEAGTAQVFCDDRLLYRVRLTAPAPNGFSYLHLQTLAGQPDEKGSYIRSLHAEKK